MQGHVRKRGKGSWEYIADIGVHVAERCRECGRRFWIERRPGSSVPSAAAASSRPRSADVRRRVASRRARKPKQP
jgi:hypothetical protein